MKQKLGGLLTVALGAVLIATGIQSGDAGQIGGPPPSCGGAIGTAVVCPTGVINITEATTIAPALAGDPTPPAGGWVVTITSTCLDPATSAAVSQVVHVPNGGNANSQPVFVFTDASATTHCQYTYSQTAVAGFTTTYDTVSPFSIPFGGGSSNSGIKVGITNTFVHVTPTTSAAPSTSPAPSSSGGNLANTGPRTQITASVYIGSGLVLLGLIMLFGGRTRRAGRRV